MNGYTDIEMHLLNDFQHRFPLVRRPFRKIGDQLGIDEEEVLAHLTRLSAAGAISRVGPVFSPGCIGASTLAALAVPQSRLEEVADWISTLPEINHNYQREHPFNLWFVAAATDQKRLDAVMEQIAQYAACPMLNLPLQERFHIDLGFDLHSGERNRACSPGSSIRVKLSGVQRSIIASMQAGIPLSPEPFFEIGMQSRIEETMVLEQVARWREQGVIKRFGVVVRHHELGYRTNAMVVWDVPDEEVGSVGKRVAQQQGVTLCYRRARQLPGWPYNLYCMVHGQKRDEVRARVGQIIQDSGLENYPMQVLFNVRRFKQGGACYVAHERHGRY